MNFFVLGVNHKTAPVEVLFARPKHPYTVGLLQAIPSMHEERDSLMTIPGVVPRLIDPPPGCRFAPRCGKRFEPCDRVVPPLSEVEPGHAVACHLYPGAPEDATRRSAGTDEND